MIRPAWCVMQYDANGAVRGRVSPWLDLPTASERLASLLAAGYRHLRLVYAGQP